MKLQDRVTVVTGGGSGIGAAICKAFASEGAVVVVGDINRCAAEQIAEDISESGGTSAVKVFDVCDVSATEKAACEVEIEIGPISVWVNNAGVSYIMPFLECSEDQWNKTLRVNLTGTYAGCRAAITCMLSREQGVIINMSSQSGKVGNSHYAAYCASKFGIIGLTQSLAMEFAGSGIRVNALCPGVVMTPLWEGMLDDYAAKRGLDPKDVRPYLESKIPMGRLCSPEDVANYAVFLASDEAAYITGQSVNISGGSIM